MKRSISFKLIAVLAGVLLTNVANAQWDGLWQIAQYDFQTRTKINDVVACLYTDGTFKMGQGTYKMDPLPIEGDWVGHWKSRGDEVLIRGETVDGQHSNAYSLLASNYRLLTGYGQSWPIGATWNGYYATAVWNFVRRSC